jgi:hypothetical protein
MKSQPDTNTTKARFAARDWLITCPDVPVERPAAASCWPELIYSDSSTLSVGQQSHAAWPLQRKLGPYTDDDALLPSFKFFPDHSAQSGFIHWRSADRLAQRLVD